MGTKTDLPPLTEVGLYKEYIPANLYAKCKVGKMNLLDPVIAIILAIGYFKLMVGSVVDTLNSEEGELVSFVILNKSHKFFLGTTPPFAIQLFSFFSHYWKGIQLKYSVLVMSSLCLFLIYMILRRNNVSTILSTLTTVAIANLPHFQTQSISLSTNVIFWLTLLGTMYFWRLYRIQKGPILVYLAHVGVFLGLGMATKSLGFITWFWIICCSLYDTWNTIDDITVTTYDIVKKILLKFWFIVVVPLQIFVLINYNQINSFQLDSLEYSRYMSPYFQSYLRGGIIHTTETHEVHFGDTIQLRHTASLGGYLTSHNVTVDDPDEVQFLVSLSSDENSDWTHWIIENANPRDDSKPIRKYTDIKLRHKLTGKLLRASDSKPPISEQEYDRLVCTTGDIDYDGNSDEKWVFQTVEYSTEKFSNKDMFNIDEDRLKLYNQGRRCTLLGHDIRLPEWGNFDQEVLCLDNAMNKFAEFQIKVIESNESKMVDVVVPHYNKFKLIFEWLWRQYRYTHYIKNMDGGRTTIATVLDFQVETWPFKSQVEGDIVVNNIWILSILGTIMFGMYITYKIVTWNPWSVKEVTRHPISVTKVLFQDIGLEYCLGWFLHFYIFVLDPSRDKLSIVSYFPSYIFGLLLFAQVLHTVTTKYPWSSMILPIYIAILYKLAH